MEIRFPERFVWGVATAAYQVEGAAREDGRGASIWDAFAHTPGKIEDGSTGDVACDHYRRYAEDVALMRELGLGAYRFSTSWSRLLPAGRGRLNPKGADFYDRLIDALLESEIAPWLCLYHWDLPQALQEKGGWAARDTAQRFTDYAEQVAGRYGDRVAHFVMLNEPSVAALLGHLLGVHAPGQTDLAAFAAAMHHFNLATGLGLARLRERSSAWQLGTVLNLQPVHPASESEADQRAAALFDAVWNRACLDPLLRGGYPEPLAAMLEPVVCAGDEAAIRQPLDFLGVNYYTRIVVEADPGSLVGLRQREPGPGAETTAMGWEVYPEGLREVLLELKERYGNPPLYITENGAAYDDAPNARGEIDDAPRIRYLERHLVAVAEALRSGADVRGYFVWSLLDNFEWAEGYAKRFGLVHTDFATLKRTPKRSYGWFRQLVRERGFDPVG